jgi:hypothetical protein
MNSSVFSAQVVTPPRVLALLLLTTTATLIGAPYFGGKSTSRRFGSDYLLWRSS